MIDKIYAYYKQDRKKGRLPSNIYRDYQSHVSDLNLRVDDITNLIKKNGLNCSYCYKPIFICPERHNKEQYYLQLTLDRIDDRYPHSIDNCVLSCLRCNITNAIIKYDIVY